MSTRPSEQVISTLSISIHSSYVLPSHTHVAPLGLSGICLSVYYKHVAPLGLWLFAYPAYYKHVAPLVLNIRFPFFVFPSSILNDISGLGNLSYSGGENTGYQTGRVGF
jgi:hypothetical protein